MDPADDGSNHPVTFHDLGLPAALITALAAENIVNPTAIQHQAIPPVLDHQDVYISSPTGTGKTLAYALPLLAKIDVASKDLHVIILTPTHELSSQIHARLLLLNQNSGLGFRSQLLIGGASTKRQIEKLKKKPHLIVGSVGRVLELIAMKKLKVQAVRTLVIDEADSLLFADSLSGIKKILERIPAAPQLILVSATNQPETNAVAAALSPAMVQAHAESNHVARHIEHIWFSGHENEKPDLLRKILRAWEPQKAIVFTHRNDTAIRIAQGLINRGFTVSEIHGKCDKLTREKSINAFRQGKTTVMVASDMGARGLDIKGVSHVFNVDIPGQSLAYLHRAGRTGRAGEKGVCVSLVSPEEEKIIRRFERELDVQFTQAAMASGKSVTA
ncbi:MAG: DEAD/DEAH box helicase [Lentisphaeria bacterium]|nr:DEAD/DEAH box helicase [Lentisphaeria bacterium]